MAESVSGIAIVEAKVNRRHIVIKTLNFVR